MGQHTRSCRMLIALLALSLLAATPSWSCSTFVLTHGEEVLFGRNYDFEIGHGVVMLNKRGVLKRSLAGTTTWISRFGSVTFNQFGKEFPMDGMNEAGLVVALMWLEGTRYPAADARPALSVLEWIQYQLDNRESVQDLLAHADLVRIQGNTPLHYLVADATGDAATIEYLQGRLVVHRGTSLPTANLTNSSYAESLAYLRRQRSIPSGFGSLERFARTAMLMQQATDGRSLREHGMGILDNVAQPGWTRWSILYDARGKRIDWKTFVSGDMKSLALAEMDFSCETPMLVADVDTGQWRMYSADQNRAMIARSYAGTSFLRSLPASVPARDAEHDESSRCAPAGRNRAVRR